MLLSAQLCSAVTASEEVSAGTHTRVTSDVKPASECISSCPLNVANQRGTRGGLVVGKLPVTGLRIVLCAARTAKGEEEGVSQAAYPGGQRPHWRSKPNFRARVREGTNGTLPPASWAPPSFQASTLLLLLTSLLPPSPPFHVYSFVEHPSAMCQTQRLIVCSWGYRVPDLH